MFGAFLQTYAADQRRSALYGMLRRLPPEVRAEFDPSRPSLGVLPWRWYPSRYVHALLDVVTVGLTDAQRRALARESNRSVVKVLLRGPFRWLLATVTTPYLYADHIQKLWNMLHDTGYRRITFPSPHTAESSIESWPGITRCSAKWSTRRRLRRSS